MKQVILAFTIAILAWVLSSKLYQINRIGPSGYGFRTTALDVAKRSRGSTNQKVVLITGATSGLGFESAKAFTSIGASVLIGGRTMAKAQDATDRLVEYVFFWMNSLERTHTPSIQRTRQQKKLKSRSNSM